MKDVLDQFDEFLYEKQLSFNGVIIGGTALILMNITNRFTRDIDFIEPVLPSEIKLAAKTFLNQNKQYQLDAETWLNNGPISIIESLPIGWQNKKVKIYSGKAIILYTLGRLDLLKTKLYAYCDRDIDLNDCIALKPTLTELDNCIEWVLQGDANEHWPNRVNEQFQKLKKALGHG